MSLIRVAMVVKYDIGVLLFSAAGIEKGWTFQYIGHVGLGMD